MSITVTAHPLRPLSAILTASQPSPKGFPWGALLYSAEGV